MSDNVQDRSRNKFDLWERKLLDLSARNALLNCKLKGKAVPLLVTSCCDAEDLISQEKDYAVLPRTDAGENEDKTPKIPDFEFEFEKISDTSAIAEVLTAGINADKPRIYTPLTEKEYDDRMKQLYRSAKLAVEEDGAGTLFLACGFLKWNDDGKTEPYYAPLVLVPVELKRKIGLGKYAMKKTDEDVSINITILEKLRQDFDINIEELGGELPCDASGVDVKAILDTFRGAVAPKDGWEIVDACVLGMFSFSQFVMWNDLHNHREEISANKIVKSLLEGGLTWDYEDMERSAASFTDDGSVYLPISADSSQLYAIRRAKDGASFVLHGPPGTGKSQTITSMIANAIADGKKVLFVAEKKAALDVVYSRLGKIGIAPFCLELHSNKVRKSYVLDQLETAMAERVKAVATSGDGYQSMKDNVIARRAELDSYMTALCETQSCGYSLFEMLNVYGKYKASPDVILDEGFEQDMSEAKVAACKAALGELKASGKGLSGVLGAVKATEYSQDTKVQLAPELDSLEQAADRLESAVRAFVAAYPKTGSGEDFASVRRLADAVVRYTKARADILKDWTPEFLALDGAAKKAELAAAESKFALFRSGAVGKVYDSVKAYDKSGAHRGDLDAQLDSLNAYKAEYSAYGFEADSPKMSPVMTDLLACKDDYSKAYGAVKARLGLEDEVLMPDNGSIAAVKALISDIRTNENSIRSKTIFNACAARCAELKISGVVKAFEDGVISEDQLEPAFSKAWSKLMACGIIDSTPVLKGFSGKIFDEKVKQLKKISDDFELMTRQEIYHKIAASLPEIKDITAAASSGLGTLQKAIKSKGRNISIRSLLTGIQGLILNITPCVLMSPMSVAQFIAPSSDPMFDLVVFDEASQLPTCKAVGVIARGKEAVIVGDPKQMPPTSFFKEQVSYEEDPETEDLESILDDCLAVSMPETHLLWHYRSRHESLIAFSNKAFYENKLYTFPSVDDQTSLVTLTKCAGSFDSGKTRTNEAEAASLTEELVKCFKNAEKSGRTYGIVTFNIQQQSLIEDKIDEECRKDPEFEKWAFGGEEPIFIKNLENVQGDERDVILFSVNYGPDEEGKVSMNFGPINKDGGWRRLNVAVTRSRCEMKVFSSLPSEKIKAGEGSPEGVLAFKRFLMYAEQNTLWDSDLAPAPDAGNSTVSFVDINAKTRGIKESIRTALAAEGYSADTDIGKSGFKVDVGVIDPDDPESYCLGILIDGSSVNTGASASTREIEQPAMLRSLGWNVIKIWSLEWWEDPKKVIAQCIDAINNRNKPDPDPEPTEEAEEPVAEESPAPEQTQKKTEFEVGRAPSSNYVKAAVNLPALSSKDFCDPANIGLLTAACKTVVETESPICFDVLVERLTGACGITRKTAPVKDRCEYLVKALHYPTTKLNLAMDESADYDRVFVWKDAEFIGSVLPEYRVPAAGEDMRDCREITLEEASCAACYVARSQFGMPIDNLIEETGRALGFRTNTPMVKILCDKAVRHAIGIGELEFNSRIVK